MTEMLCEDTYIDRVKYTATCAILFDLYHIKFAEPLQQIPKSEERGKKEQQKEQKEQLENAGRILSEYGDAILRLSYSYLHSMDDAEDIVQDTLMQYIKTAPIFHDANHEKAWLLRVAINRCKNKLKHNHYISPDELDEQMPEPVKDDLRFIWEAVKTLPEKYQEVIHLYYQEGYSTSEVARLLSKKESTVRSLLLRARNMLKDTLKEEYDFEV